MPNLTHEKNLHPHITAGCDEVGRGPLAGPVIAAAVIIPKNINPAIKTHLLTHANDSKKLSPAKREDLFTIIQTHCPHAIQACTPEEIDTLNIRTASLTAMHRAIIGLPTAATYALVDGNAQIPDLPIPQQTIIKGDSISLSIACASILAKVTRDALMADLHQKFPHYNWAKNKGYPTPDHLAALTTHGITPHHRTTFGPVTRILQKDKKNVA